MAAPRNNLKDVLANAPVTPSKSSKVAHGPSSTTGRPKFKPATASNPNSSIPDVRKTASYASFTTPGFGKTKPVPPLAPLNTHVASSSSSCPQPLAATSSSEAQAVPLVMNAHSFSKRASPASFSTIDPPLKRTRPSLEPDKENRIESDTQIVDLTEAEDSGYISLKGKGRDTSALTCPPPNTVTPGTPTTRLATPTNQQGDSSHVAPSSGMVRSSSRVFSFEFEDLLSMSDAELEAHRQEILNARGQIMDLRSQAERPLAAIFRKFDEVLQDRLQCLTACQGDQGGRTRQLPLTRWIASPPPSDPFPTQALRQLGLPRVPLVMPITPIAHPSPNDDAIEDEFPIIDNLDMASDDELWEQSGTFDDRDFNSQVVPTSVNDYLIVANNSGTLVGSVLSSPIEELDPTLIQAPTYQDIMRTLRDVFKLQSFRKNQLEAITAFMAGHDAFILMPTGGGKSLCFQLPAVCKNQANNSVTVVVGPLLALMQDQVTALEAKGLDIVSFSKDNTNQESNVIHARLNHHSKKPCMLYVTPEKLEHSNKLKNDLRKLHQLGQLGGIVIDEAHCISTWGRSFRDSYTKLDWMREEFPGVPFMALTATANKQAVEDIITKLGIPGCKRFTMSFNRKNLFYEVRAKKNDNVTTSEIMNFIQEKYPNGSGIVYLNNKAKCDKTAELFRKHGFRAASYHADMTRETKLMLQNKWQSGEIQVIIATIAFGMGIDKPDVRFVIHFGLPNSLSEYYQETGRAGRDGKPSHCRLYFAWRDADWKIKCARDEAKDEADKEDAIENVLRVFGYCQNTVDCRRVQVLSYFDENFDKADCSANCDNCQDTSEVTYEDLTISTYKLLELARKLCRIDITRPKLLEQFAKESDNGLNNFNKGEAKERAERIFERLYTLGILGMNLNTGDQQWSVSYVEVTRKAEQFIRQHDRIEIPFRHRPKRTRKPRAAPIVASNDVPTDDPGISHPPAKRSRGARPVEIEDDPISLYVSDEEIVTPRAAVQHTVTHSFDNAYTESDFATTHESVEAIMKRCEIALRKRVAELQIDASDDVDALFNEDTIVVLSVVLPADIETFRTELRKLVEDVDFEKANKYIPALITECIKYRALLPSAPGDQRQHAKPLSIGHYEYRQASTSKPASGRRRV